MTWLVTIAVALGGYAFLSGPALIYVNESFLEGTNGFTETQRSLISWIWFAFIIAGPIAMAIAVFRRIDGPETRLKARLKQRVSDALSVFLRQQFENGWQRWDVGGGLRTELMVAIDGQTSDEGREIFASMVEDSDYHPMYVPKPHDAADLFLFLAGRSVTDRTLPCSISTAALGVDEQAPEWVLSVRAVRKTNAGKDHPEGTTIGELASTARDELHESALDLVEGDYAMIREHWVNLLSPRCEVELPDWAAAKLGLPPGVTFGQATAANAWPFEELRYDLDASDR